MSSRGYNLCARGAFPDVVGVDLGGQERVGAAFGHRDDPGLGERGPVRPGPGVPELGGVLSAVRQVDLEPVDRHQPPPRGAGKERVT